MRLLRNLGVVSGFTLLSRVLGFAREILTAARLGAGPASDIFFQAFLIPNTFRRLLAEGAFTAAFVPLYAGRMEAEGQAEADRFAREAMSVLVTASALIVVVFQLAAPWLVYPFFLERATDPETRGLTILLLQIVMPYLLCMAVAALLGGALNSHGKFAAAAGAPTLLNILLIGVLLVDAPSEARLVTHMSIAVSLSGVLQAGLLMWAAKRSGLSFGLRPPKLTPGVKRLFALGVPGAIAAGATQINILTTSSVSMLQEGARSWMNYAERLYQLPLGVIGIAMGVALLPNLARRVRAGDETGGAFAMNRAIELSLALTLPAAAAFAAIPGFLVQGLFEWDKFTPADTQATAYALTCYAVGLPAFVMVKVLSPGFFAREDTRTPMAFAISSMAVNLVLGVALFFGGLGYIGLAIATSVAGWVNMGLLALTLTRRRLFAPDARLAARAPRLLFSAALMAAAVFVAVLYAEDVQGALMEAGLRAGLARSLVLGAVVALGGAVYGLSCMVTGALRLSEFAEALKPARGARPDPAAGEL